MKAASIGFSSCHCVRSIIQRKPGGEKVAV
jgi:hypothetical protein